MGKNHCNNNHPITRQSTSHVGHPPQTSTSDNVPLNHRLRPRRSYSRRRHYRLRTSSQTSSSPPPTKNTNPNIPRHKTKQLRAGSIPSLAAGCSVGALYALGGYRLQNRASYGVEAALLASVVLAGSSIPRAIKTQKGLPVGLSVLAAFGLYNFGMAFANRTR